MIISLIVARSDNGVIGRDRKLPWRLPADLRHFKTTTMGKPVIMGRRTWESIGKPLPGRTNIVLTREPGYTTAGCLAAHSLDEGLELAGEAPEIMIIGGEAVYREALPKASRIYLTEVHATVEGDAFFPELDTDEWQETRRDEHAADETVAFDYSFVTLERRA